MDNNLNLKETLNALESLIENKGLVSLQSPCPSTTERMLNRHLYEVVDHLRMVVDLADDLGYKSI